MTTVLWKDVPTSPSQGARELLIGLLPVLVGAVLLLVCNVIPLPTDEGRAAMAGLGTGWICATIASLAWARACLRKRHWIASIKFTVAYEGNRADHVRVDRVVMRNKYVPGLDWVLAGDVAEEHSAKLN